MSSIQRSMTRAMARTGFAKKMIARQKEKVDKRNRAIEDQMKSMKRYTDTLPVAPGVTTVDILT